MPFCGSPAERHFSFLSCKITSIQNVYKEKFPYTGQHRMEITKFRNIFRKQYLFFPSQRLIAPVKKLTVKIFIYTND